MLGEVKDPTLGGGLFYPTDTGYLCCGLTGWWSLLPYRHWVPVLWTHRVVVSSTPPTLGTCVVDSQGGGLFYPTDTGYLCCDLTGWWSLLPTDTGWWVVSSTPPTLGTCVVDSQGGGLFYPTDTGYLCCGLTGWWSLLAH